MKILISFCLLLVFVGCSSPTINEEMTVVSIHSSDGGYKYTLKYQDSLNRTNYCTLTTRHQNFAVDDVVKIINKTTEVQEATKIAEMTDSEFLEDGEE